MRSEDGQGGCPVRFVESRVRDLYDGNHSQPRDLQPPSNTKISPAIPVPSLSFPPTTMDSTDPTDISSLGFTSFGSSKRPKHNHPPGPSSSPAAPSSAPVTGANAIVPSSQVRLRLCFTRIPSRMGRAALIGWEIGRGAGGR